jgi:hypothetical protein
VRANVQFVTAGRCSEHELLDPDGDSGEFDETHDLCEQLVVAGGDASELFDVVEEALAAVDASYRTPKSIIGGRMGELEGGCALKLRQRQPLPRQNA